MAIRPFKPIKITMGAKAAHKYNAAELRKQLARLAQNFQKLTAHMGEQGTEILLEALEPTFAKSQVYCPKDTGTLVKSGYLEAQQTRNGAQAAMGYAKGGNPYYAVYVHEIQRYHKDPTRWKWLQQALQEDNDDIRARIQSGCVYGSGTKALGGR